jgi:hypothetical protein
VKKAQQLLFPLRLDRFGMGPHVLTKFYSCTIESIFTARMTAWYRKWLASDCKVLQRAIYTAKFITGAKLPATQDLYTRRCQRKTLKIVKDSSYPSTRLFPLLPHSKQYRSAKSRSKRLLKLLLHPSHKTTEHLIKWLPRLLWLPATLLYTAVTLYY